ncbi:MAG: RNA polymerase sigma factor, partial [Ktedonobacteraceae bacterium]
RYTEPGSCRQEIENVAQDVEQTEGISPHTLSPEALFAERRAALARQYHTLPAYNSPTFWTLLEGCQEDEQVLPLEVLVKVLREAGARKDEQTRRRLCEIIITRVQTSNELWVRQVLASTRILAGERRDMAADLYADLCELLLRALLDPTHSFWEENFQHSLCFARKHAYESFLRREGRLISNPGKRVPRILLESLERFGTQADRMLDIRDEHAEQALYRVEQANLAATLVHLPVHQRAVIWLIFFEGQTTKTVGTLLDISERTVRNRLRAALTQLREVFEAEQEVIDGESA